MSFYIESLSISGQTAKISALRDTYQLQIMVEERDPVVFKYGIVTALSDD